MHAMFYLTKAAVPQLRELRQRAPQSTSQPISSHSSSASRVTVGAAGFLTLIQQSAGRRDW